MLTQLLLELLDSLLVCHVNLPCLERSHTLVFLEIRNASLIGLLALLLTEQRVKVALSVGSDFLHLLSEFLVLSLLLLFLLFLEPDVLL